MFLLSLLGIILGLVLGGYILFAGRKAVWATLGVVSLVVSSRLMAVMVANVESGRDLVEIQDWTLVGIALVIAIIGVTVGWFKPDLGVLIIGFAAGADVALFFYELSSYVVVSVAQLSEQVALIIGIGLIIIGGLLGLWLVRRLRDEAMILITMLIGVQLIQDALGLNHDSNWTAILIITLGLAGILTQYAVYLRELEEGQTELKPDASSIAYFQDLELDR